MSERNVQVFSELELWLVDSYVRILSERGKINQAIETELSKTNNIKPLRELLKTI